MSKNYHPVLVGQEDNRKVFFEYSEYLKVLKFAKAGASEGSRGVLLGRKVDDKTYVLAALEAVYSGRENIETPSFSPDSWGRIAAEINEHFQQLDIVGQFSTHSPSKPIRSDYIMQDRFFNETADLLFVFDPVTNSEQFYKFKSREFCFLNGFYLYDKYDIEIDLALREAVLRPLCREYELRMRIFDSIKRKIRFQNNVYAIAAIIITLFTMFNIYYSYGLEKRIDALTDFNREITEWKKE